MKFARVVFAAAGVSGIATLLPMYFLPAGASPELHYGFVGVALAWQIMFLIIASDPLRYRAAMVAAFVEKMAFGLPVVALYTQGRAGPTVLGFAMLDLAFGALFMLCFIRLRRAAPQALRV